MTPPNPYAAPHAGSPQTLGFSYVPLGWRTVMVALSVGVLTLASVVMHAMLALFGDATKDPKELAIVLVYGLAALGVFFAQVAAGVFVLVWVHRAASNLRGLGRVGMRDTPAMCVVGFLIPIASLWWPFASMKEIWCASDPGAEPDAWRGGRGTPLLGVWWGTYLVTCLFGVSTVFMHGESQSDAGIELIGDVARVVAAVALVMLMRGVGERQEEVGRREGGVGGG